MILDLVKYYSSNPKVNPFQPCDITEVLEKIDESTYALRFPACYQIADNKGATKVACGTPTIYYNNYLKRLKSIHFFGVPEQAFRHKNETHYAVIFPKGIRPLDDAIDMYETAILVLCKDLIRDGKIIRKSPRPVVFPDGRIWEMGCCK